MTTTEPRWLLRSRRQRVSCIISRLRCRVARLVQFRRFFLKRLRHAPKSTRQYHTDRTAWVSAHVIFRPQPGWSHMSAESAKEEGWSSWPHGQSHLTHHCRMECCNRAPAWIATMCRLGEATAFDTFNPIGLRSLKSMPRHTFETFKDRRLQATAFKARVPPVPSKSRNIT